MTNESPEKANIRNETRESQERSIEDAAVVRISRTLLEKPELKKSLEALVRKTKIDPDLQYMLIGMRRVGNGKDAILGPLDMNIDEIERLTQNPAELIDDPSFSYLIQVPTEYLEAVPVN